MVGRDRELGLLRTTWEAVLTERRPHLVTVVGPPGIGKTRLTREVVQLVEQTGAGAYRTVPPLRRGQGTGPSPGR